MSAVSTTLQQDQRSTHRDSGGVLEGGNSSGVSYLWPDLSHWTLLPVSHRTAGTPTLLYGPMHLLRLFGKLMKIYFAIAYFLLLTFFCNESNVDMKEYLCFQFINLKTLATSI